MLPLGALALVKGSKWLHLRAQEIPGLLHGRSLGAQPTWVFESLRRILIKVERGDRSGFLIQLLQSLGRVLSVACLLLHVLENSRLLIGEPGPAALDLLLTFGDCDPHLLPGLHSALLP
jgi:hypothetical protein